MSLSILLSNLNSCPNYNFHFKKTKRNAFNSAIDFNFVSYINNACTSMFSTIH